MTSVNLPSRCDRAFAEGFLHELVTALDSGPLEIEGSQVEQIGQATLQLLLSARRTGDCAIVRPSAAFVQMVRLAGLSATLFDDVPL